MKVKNLNVTSDKKCTVCSSWLKHWEKLSGKIASDCQKKGCANDAEVGAHVKKVDGSDNKYHIIPLCKECNKITDDFELNKDAKLVSADPCK